MVEAIQENLYFYKNVKVVVEDQKKSRMREGLFLW
jgi:hypothetical protein